MASFVLSRLIQSIPLVFGSTLVIFLIMRLIPGDPANIYAGPLAPPEAVEAVRERFGLNEPLPVQYGVWATNLLGGDLGESYLSGISVLDLLTDRIPATVELTLAAMAVTILVGLLSGVLAAIKQGTRLDKTISFLAGLMVAMPSYWLGILAIYVFAIALDWLPPGGRVSLLADPFEGGKYLLMPAVILATNPAATLSRIVRGSMLEVMREDYVRTAVAKGLGARTITVRHILRNALVPVVTVIALQFGRLLGGAVVTESIFAWPGLGRLLLTALSGRDYAVVQGALLTLVLAFTFINLITDIVYGMLDPRIRVGRSAGG